MRLSELPAAALLVVFAVVTVVVGSMVLSDMRTSIWSDNTKFGNNYFNTTESPGRTWGTKLNTSFSDSDTALGNITDWMDIVTLVIAASVIIGVLGLMRMGGGGL